MALSRGPNHNEFEFTLLGPGYGECVVLHVGNGNWVAVDSYADSNGMPIAMRYLEGMGFDPAQSVILIAAAQWHDDHIRGMANLLKFVPKPNSAAQLYCVIKSSLQLQMPWERGLLPSREQGLEKFIADYLDLKIWSLSPNDARLQDFLRSVSRMLPSSVHPKRNPSLSPNKTAIALWLEFGKTVAGWHWHRRCALGSAEALLKGLFNDLDPSCNDGDHPRALRHSFEVVFDQRLIEEVHLPTNSRAETHSINIHEFEKMPY